MRLPFTIDQFLDVFRRYNTAVWPAQWLLVALAVVALVFALRDRRGAARLVSAILALLWLWTAVAYHVAFFASVNRAALAFAAGFVVQSLLFAWLAWRPASIHYWPRSAAAGVVGALLIAYALVGYPALGLLLGHRYPAAPTFGVPCPTTIFTLGMLVWARDVMPWRLLVIPLGWAAVATAAAAMLGMTEDYGLLVAALATAGAFLTRRRGEDAVRRIPGPVAAQP